MGLAGPHVLHSPCEYIYDKENSFLLLNTVVEFIFFHRLRVSRHLLSCLH